jgi:hypothetical protein
MNKEQLKGINDMMKGVNDALKLSIAQMPPEQQADFNKYQQDIMSSIPSLDDFMKGDKTAAQMQKDINESNEKIRQASNEITKKYANNSNR